MWQLSDVSVIKGFADKTLCKKAVHVMALAGNRHEVSINSTGFKTPHVMQLFNIEKLTMPDELKQIFYPMKDKWEELGGPKVTWDDNKLRPQIIHYPRGGGFFGKHEHPLEPQKFGLILSLTDGPGTIFHFPEGDLQTHREEGDLTIFRYDIPHSVGMVDPGVPLEFFRPTGRWTAILPYY